MTNTQPEEWESKLNERLDSSIKYNWEGGFERKFLIDFINSEIRKAEERVYNQAITDAVEALPGLITKGFRELNPEKENSFNAWDCVVKEAVRNLEALKK